MQHLLHIRLPTNLILNDSLPFLYAFQQTGIIFKQFIYHYQAIIYISRYCIIIKFQRLSISLFQHITSLFHSTGHTISSCYTLVCQYNAFIIHVTRKGCSIGLHSSERELDTLYKKHKFDISLVNNGTLKELFNKCKNIVYGY